MVVETNHQQRAFTLVELLVVLFVIGILVALLLPAIQAARESARSTQCFNQLRQMGIALTHYHDAHGHLPPGGIEPRPKVRNGRQIAWSAFLLPYLEQQTVHERIDFSEAFDSPVNAEVASTVIPLYLCPSTLRDSRQIRGRGACDYGGIYGERITSRNNPPKGTMIYDRAIEFREIYDGLSYTLVIAEDSNWPDGQWINGRNVFDQAFAINKAPKFENDIRSRHPNGANVLFVGGAARFLDNSLDLNVLAALCTRAGAEPHHTAF